MTATVLLSAADARTFAASAAVLSQQGLNVRHATGATMAVFEATRLVPDAIVLDTSLGVKTTIEMCQQLAANPRTTSIPIVISCREATREFLSHALRAGVEHFLAHPISPLVLTRKLTKVLEASRPAPDADGTPPSPGKVNLNKLVRQLSELKPIPPVVERVVRISGDVQAGAQELARAVSMDQAATALVLLVANSFGFGGARRIDNVAEAIMRIGFQKTRSLVVGKGVMQAFTPATQSVGFDRVECWRHALATAILAKQIAEQNSRVSTDFAFIAGLLHDVGKILLDEFCGAEFERAVHRAIQKHIPLTDAEGETLQTTHVEVATQALRAWNFPQAVVDAVRFQHGAGLETAALSGESRLLCQATYAANAMAKATGIGHGGDTFVSEIPENVWDELKLGRGLPKWFWVNFDKDFKECHSFLGIGYADPPGFVANRGVGLISLENGGAVNLLRIALESAGWTVAEASEPGSLPKDLAAEDLAFVVVRSVSTESLAAAMPRWVPVAGTRPLVGVLPAGCTPPGEWPCLIEPYDRDDLMNLLHQAAGTPAAQSSPL